MSINGAEQNIMVVIIITAPKFLTGRINGQILNDRY